MHLLDVVGAKRPRAYVLVKNHNQFEQHAQIFTIFVEEHTWEVKPTVSTYFRSPGVAITLPRIKGNAKTVEILRAKGAVPSLHGL